MRRICGVFLALLVLAAPLHAQTVINPRILEFLASPDHTVTLPDGSPLVASYEARWYLQGATTPVASISLAKPTPDATGLIRLSLTDPRDLLVGVPIDPRVTYVARVAAIAPDGTEGVSLESNPFVRTTSPKAPGPPKLSK